MSDFEKVLEQVRVEDVVSKFLGRKGKPVGVNLDFGECPFCGGHDCFRVNPGTQFFNCFQCQAGGDAITFVRLINKLPSNYDALMSIAAEIGFKLGNGKDAQQRTSAELTREKVFNLAADFYFKNFTVKAYRWFRRKRFHSKDMIKKFRVGWTGNSRTGLRDHLFAMGVSEKDMLASGLVKSYQGKVKDFFSPHLYIFPWMLHNSVGHFTIKDPTKKMVYQLPKDFRSSEILFYNQGNIFFDRLILVEGENDVMTVSAGIEDSGLRGFGVAGISGQISAEQVSFLRKVCSGKEVYLAFDNDPAGEKYTRTLVEALISDNDVFVFDLNKKYKDIDEFMRGSETIGTDLKLLVKGSVDGIEWLINGLEDCDHPLKIRKLIEPVLSEMAKVSDDRLDAYVDLLLGRFSILKRSNVLKQLKGLGASVSGANEIRNFAVYDSTAQVLVSEKCYWVPTKDDKKMISNFCFDLKNIYSYENAVTGERYLISILQ